MKRLSVPIAIIFLLSACSKSDNNPTPPPVTPPVDSSKLTLNSMVYTTGDIGQLVALDANTGAQKWFFNLDLRANPSTTKIMSSPTLSNGVLYIGSSDHFVYAVDAATGARKWFFQTSTYNTPGFNEFESSPVVANGSVFIGGDKMYAIDAVTGTLKWSYKTTREIVSSPCYYNGYVYVNDYGGKAYKLDAANGDLIQGFYSYNTDEASFSTTSPHVHKGYLYNTGYVDYIKPKLYSADLSGDNSVFALMGWPTEQMASSGTPVFCGDTLYLAMNKAVYAYKCGTPYDMQLKWKVTFDSAIGTTVLFADTGHIYVPCYNGGIYALKTSDGSRDWTYTPDDGWVISSPTLANGILYFASKDFYHAIYAATGKELWRRPTFGNYYGQSSAVVLTKSGKVIHSNATASSD